MAEIKKSEIQRIYALGAGVGILESGNKNDDLHALVYKHTGKTAVSDLTGDEYKIVERELLRLMRFSNRPAPLKKKPAADAKEAHVPGMMNKAQQRLAWRLIYRLMELDPKSTATAGERMLGAIKKILDLDATPQDPFRWVNFEDGARLIEQLKRYVRSAERKAAKAAQREAV